MSHLDKTMLQPFLRIAETLVADHRLACTSVPMHRIHRLSQVYKKDMLNDELKGRVELEKSALKRARHRNVVNLLHVMDDENTCVLVFENCVLGDLVRQVVLHDRPPSEATIFPNIIKPVLLGLQHMHKQVCLLPWY